MNNDRTYIKITEDEDDYSPSEKDILEAEIMLDKHEDIEYTSPYSNSDDFSDIIGNGDTFEVGGIFDDR